MGADEAVWADVRRAHETSDEPAAAFCRRLGVSASAYYSRRRREGWPPRGRPRGHQRRRAGRQNETECHVEKTVPGSGAGQFQKAASARPERSGKRRRSSRRQLTKRLYSTIEQELQQLENQVARGTVDGVGDLERRSRTLMTMIRSLEKVLELDADKSKRTRQGAKRTEQQARDNIDQLRQEIAERLERLHAEWEHSTAPKRARPKDD